MKRILLLTLFLFPATATAQDFCEEDEVMDEEGFCIGENNSVRATMTPEQFARTAGAAHRFDEKSLQAQKSDDPHAMMSQAPSVFVRTEDGFGLRPNIGIRGAQSERSKKVTLMEDGILFGPAPYSAPAAYYFPMVNRMAGLEVFKGPAAVRFGPQSIGGAINFLSRPIPYDAQGAVDLNFGSFNTGKAHAHYGMSSDWGGFSLEGVEWLSGGFKEIDGGGNTGFDRSEFILKGKLNSDVNAPEYFESELKLGFSREISNETYLGLTDADFRENPARRYAASQLDEMNWWRTQIELRNRLEIGRHFNVTATLYRHDLSRIWRRFNGFSAGNVSEALANPDAGINSALYDILGGADSGDGEAIALVDNDRNFVSQGIQIGTQWTMKKYNYRNDLRLTARLHHDTVQRVHTGSTYQQLNGVLSRDETPRSISTDNTGSTLALSTSLTDTVQLFDVSISPGVRIEHIRSKLVDRNADTVSEREDTIVLPGFGVYYTAGKWYDYGTFGILAGIYRGFSPVSPGQADDLKPETAINYEAGFRYNLGADSLLEVIGFVNDYDNLLGDCTFSAGCDSQDIDNQFNGGAVLTRGLEVVAEHTFDSDVIEGAIVPLRIAYTYTDTNFQTSFSSPNPQFGEVAEGDELPYIPTHQANLRLGLESSEWSFLYAANFVGAMREVAGSGDGGIRTDAYLLSDFIVKHRLFEPTWVYAKVDNITDAQPIASRRPFGARPLKPRLFQVGINVTF